MEDKFKLNTSCKYCEKPMDAKYRSKRFCSPKCRVYFGRENQLKEVLAKGYDKDLLDNIEENNKPENKERILKERNTVNAASTKSKNPLTENEARHPLWKEGDPKEGSMGFYSKYGVSTYSELESKLK